MRQKGAGQAMFLTLREKKMAKLRFLFRAAVLAADTFGLFVCLYLEEALIMISGSTEKGDVNSIFLGNGFLLEEFTAAVQVAQLALGVLVGGLCVLIYHLAALEAKARARTRRLLSCLGYRDLQIILYEFTYELWDFLSGFMTSSVVVIFFRKRIAGIENVQKLLAAVSWDFGNDAGIFLLVFLLLMAFNILCSCTRRNYGFSN